MNKLKTIIGLLLICGLSVKAQSNQVQTWEVPIYSFVKESPASYTKYCDDIIKCHEWLQTTPIGEQEPKRKKCNSFLYNWCADCKDVLIDLRSETMSNDIDMILSYMGGYSKCALENKIDTNQEEGKIQCMIAGVNAEIELYNANESYFSKNKDVKKLISKLSKLRSKNELEKYVRNLYKTKDKKNTKEE